MRLHDNVTFFPRSIYMTDKVQPVEISVEALRKGDRAEFARLVENYSTPIYRLALRMVNNDQDAEDILQETLF